MDLQQSYKLWDFVFLILSQNFFHFHVTSAFFPYQTFSDATHAIFPAENLMNFDFLNFFCLFQQLCFDSK